MFHDEAHVKTSNGVVIWDGITKPEVKDDGKQVFSVKIAILPDCPEIAELTKIANDALVAHSVFKGQLPVGGNWPLIPVDVAKTPELAGRTAINAKTFNGVPPVFDANGQQLDPMQYGQMLYPGAIVKILVHAYSFNNVSKGVAFGLDGIGIVDATAPRLSIAAGVDASAAFGNAGGQPPVAPVNTPPAAPGVPPVVPPTAAITPAPDFLNPGAPPVPPSAATPPAASGPVMTAKANGQPYVSFITAGWTEEQLRAQGYIV